MIVNTIIAGVDQSIMAILCQLVPITIIRAFRRQTLVRPFDQIQMLPFHRPLGRPLGHPFFLRFADAVSLATTLGVVWLVVAQVVIDDTGTDITITADTKGHKRNIRRNTDDLELHRIRIQLFIHIYFK